jgi:peptide/nickel transport system permease protein
MLLVAFIKKNFTFLLGSLMLVLLLFFTFIGPSLPFIDAKKTLYLWIDKIPTAPPFGPSKKFIFGSDRLGRDMASLLVLGAKETLFMVVSITLVRYVLAIPLGFFAHKRKFGAQAILNFLNGFFAYIPSIIIFVLIATLPPFLTSPSRPLILMVVLAIIEMGRAADMIKAEFENLSSREFILAGVAIGATPLRLLRFYYLPFLYDKLLISVITDMGKVMFLLGQIGFIGIFISQELLQVDPGIFILNNKSLNWTVLLQNAFSDLRSAIWIPFFPALAITYTIFSFNIFAIGLKNLFNKRENYR